ncbi:MAG: hypothetical protein ABL962_14235 [Fimbriimonadaceae bacterium]
MLSEQQSPNGKFSATIFERNCGATTPYVRVVSLRASEHEFDPEQHDDWVFTIHEQTQIQVSWETNSKLHISFSSAGDKPTQREQWKGIAISYE